jgi:PleD family two-component response regulator
MPDRRVLIVEDTESAGEALEMALLAIPDVCVTLMRSATEALQVLAADGGTVRALITDLNMPHMSGFELIERVRADSRHARLPIVVVSGDTEPATPDRVRRLGVHAFFLKPYSPAEVRHKLEQLLDENTA